MKYFVTESTVRTGADLDSMHRNIAVRFFYKLQCTIAVKQQERAAQLLYDLKIIQNSQFQGYLFF